MFVVFALTAAHATDYTDHVAWSSAAGVTDTFTYTDLAVGDTVTSQHFGYFYGGDDVVADGTGMTTDDFLLSGGSDIRINLIFPAVAVAADFPGGLVIELLDAAGNLLYTSADFGGTGPGWFGGVVLGTPFTTIRLRDWSDGQVDIDNLYVGRGAGPTLDLSGSCPAAADISATGFPAHGQVAIARSSGPGSFTLGAGPCPGLQLDLAPAGLALVNVVSADSNGEIGYVGPVPVGLCSGSVQLVDLSTCTTTNVDQF